MTAHRDLKHSIYQALAGSKDVIASLGGVNLSSETPQSAAHPFLTFGQTADRDWSTGEQKIGAHTVTLHVWSNAGGSEKTQEIIERVRSALNRAPITIEGDRKVQLHHEFSEVHHDEHSETFHGIVRYKAFTEPFG